MSDFYLNFFYFFFLKLEFWSWFFLLNTLLFKLIQSILKKNRKLQSYYLHSVVVTFTFTRKIQEYKIALGDKKEKKGNILDLNRTQKILPVFLVERVSLSLYNKKIFYSFFVGCKIGGFFSSFTQENTISRNRY